MLFSWSTSGGAPETYPGGVVIEVKAVDGTLTKSYQYYQLVGMIEVARDTVAFQSGRHPWLLIPSTVNTTISQDLQDYATENGVALYKQTVFRWPGGRLQPGVGVVANPGVYGAMWEQALTLLGFLQGERAGFVQPGLIGKLAEPGPGVPGDPDPAELQ